MIRANLACVSILNFSGWLNSFHGCVIGDITGSAFDRFPPKRSVLFFFIFSFCLPSFYKSFRAWDFCIRTEFFTCLFQLFNGFRCGSVLGSWKFPSPPFLRSCILCGKIGFDQASPASRQLLPVYLLPGCEHFWWSIICRFEIKKPNIYIPKIFPWRSCRNRTHRIIALVKRVQKVQK